MMWYAWVYYEGPLDSFERLSYGSLEDIAGDLIDNGEDILNNIDESWDEGDEKENRKWFNKLKKRKRFTEKIIKDYEFNHCGCRTCVCFLVKGFSEFVKKFNAYAEEEDLFYRLRSDIEETEENISEIHSYFYYGKEGVFDKFFIEVED